MIKKAKTLPDESPDAKPLAAFAAALLEQLPSGPVNNLLERFRILETSISGLRSMFTAFRRTSGKDYEKARLARIGEILESALNLCQTGGIDVKKFNKVIDHLWEVARLLSVITGSALPKQPAPITFPVPSVLPTKVEENSPRQDPPVKNRSDQEFRRYVAEIRKAFSIFVADALWIPVAPKEVRPLASKAVSRENVGGSRVAVGKLRRRGKSRVVPAPTGIAAGENDPKESLKSRTVKLANREVVRWIKALATDSGRQNSDEFQQVLKDLQEFHDFKPRLRASKWGIIFLSGDDGPDVILDNRARRPYSPRTKKPTNSPAEYEVEFGLEEGLGPVMYLTGDLTKSDPAGTPQKAMLPENRVNVYDFSGYSQASEAGIKEFRPTLIARVKTRAESDQKIADYIQRRPIEAENEKTRQAFAEFMRAYLDFDPLDLHAAAALKQHVIEFRSQPHRRINLDSKFLILKASGKRPSMFFGKFIPETDYDLELEWIDDHGPVIYFHAPGLHAMGFDLRSYLERERIKVKSPRISIAPEANLRPWAGGPAILLEEARARFHFNLRVRAALESVNADASQQEQLKTAFDRFTAEKFVLTTSPGGSLALTPIPSHSIDFRKLPTRAAGYVTELSFGTGGVPQIILHAGSGARTYSLENYIADQKKQEYVVTQLQPIVSRSAQEALRTSLLTSFAVGLGLSLAAIRVLAQSTHGETVHAMTNGQIFGPAVWIAHVLLLAGLGSLFWIYVPALIGNLKRNMKPQLPKEFAALFVFSFPFAGHYTGGHPTMMLLAGAFILTVALMLGERPIRESDTVQEYFRKAYQKSEVWRPLIRALRRYHRMRKTQIPLDRFLSDGGLSYTGLTVGQDIENFVDGLSRLVAERQQAAKLGKVRLPSTNSILTQWISELLSLNRKLTISLMDEEVQRTLIDLLRDDPQFRKAYEVQLRGIFIDLPRRIRGFWIAAAYVISQEVIFSWILLNLVPEAIALSGFSTILWQQRIEDFLWFLSTLSSGLLHFRLHYWSNSQVFSAGPVNWYHRAFFVSLAMVFRSSYLLEPFTGFTHFHHFAFAMVSHLLYTLVLARLWNLPLADIRKKGSYSSSFVQAMDLARNRLARVGVLYPEETTVVAVAIVIEEELLRESLARSEAGLEEERLDLETPTDDETLVPKEEARSAWDRHLQNQALGNIVPDFTTYGDIQFRTSLPEGALSGGNKQRDVISEIFRGISDTNLRLLTKHLPRLELAKPLDSQETFDLSAIAKDTCFSLPMLERMAAKHDFPSNLIKSEGRTHYIVTQEVAAWLVDLIPISTVTDLLDVGRNGIFSWFKLRPSQSFAWGRVKLEKIGETRNGYYFSRRKIADIVERYYLRISYAQTQRELRQKGIAIGLAKLMSFFRNPGRFLHPNDVKEVFGRTGSLLDSRRRITLIDLNRLVRLLKTNGSELPPKIPRPRTNKTFMAA